jgi:hypothetical protein
MDLADYLTPQERTILARHAETRKADVRERKQIIDRARMRMKRKLAAERAWPK